MILFYGNEALYKSGFIQVKIILIILNIEIILHLYFIIEKININDALYLDHILKLKFIFHLMFEH
jgi:hypothetical protein